jgi:antitoxin HicB
MTTANRTPEEYLAGPYGLLLVREPQGGFSAEILEFPGCIAEGETADEAVNNLEGAAKAWIESELDSNHKIPAAASGDEYSGRLALRLPRSLHRALALKAHRDGTSINTEVVTAIASWLGSDGAIQRLTPLFSQRAMILMPRPIMTVATVGTSGGTHRSAPARVGSGADLYELEIG